MANVTHQTALPDSSNKVDFYNLVDSSTVTGIVNADIQASAAIVDTKLATISTAGKVSSAAITSLSLIPSGAGVIPAVNLPNSIADSHLATISTAGKVSGAALTSLTLTPSGAGIIPIANLATGTPTGLKFIRDDGTLQLFNSTAYTAGDYLVQRANFSVIVTGVTPTKTHEFYLQRSGTLRIKFNIGVNSGGTAQGRIYRNGSAVGTARSGDGTYSEDISGWSVGDLCQLYLSNNAGGQTTNGGAFEIFEGTPNKEESLESLASFVAHIYSGTGVPPSALGLQGDLYTRNDGAASTTLYVKTGASTWTAK